MPSRKKLVRNLKPIEQPLLITRDQVTITPKDQSRISKIQPVDKSIVSDCSKQYTYRPMAKITKFFQEKKKPLKTPYDEQVKKELQQLTKLSVKLVNFDLFEAKTQISQRYKDYQKFNNKIKQLVKSEQENEQSLKNAELKAKLLK